MKKKILLSIITFFVGVFLTIFGFKRLLSDLDFIKNAEKKEAIVSNVIEHQNSDRTSYTTYIKYEVNGKNYEKVLLEESIIYKEKDSKITIYYNLDNPEEFIITNIYIIGAITIIGIIIIANFITNFIKWRKKTKSKKYLKENGQLLEADIIRISKKSGGYIIDCSIVINGLIKGFQSEKVWFNALGIYNALGIRKINVYVNPKNIQNYYVDVESYKKYLDKNIK